MSNRAKIKVRKRAEKEIKAKYEEEVTLTKKFSSFNVFTKCGCNKEVKSPYPMTLNEAMYYFDCLCISGIE